MNKTPGRHAFTLIELLVVIAIIGILAAMLFPAVLKAIKQARIARCSAMVTQLEVAWNSYYRDYGLWPQSYPSDQAMELDPAAVQILYGASADNPRNIRYMDLPEAIAATFDLRDEWKNRYWFAIDTDYDDDVSAGTHGVLTRIAAVWSTGPDGINYTKDDVVSWRKK
ncbi:MAG: prepilin-type N-terminal cleavage/methylation domain-containing protein [Lentisphaerae bacterium]|nr:prepilin-type N-terminal cleavage/methylation domain-containing protein [Lentisphaerota bacterium]